MNNLLDAEEVERLLSSLSKCRICHHLKLAHTSLHKNKGACIEGTLDSNGVYVVCKCTQFQPADNLEYLAWKHEQKNKKEKHK